MKKIPSLQRKPQLFSWGFPIFIQTFTFWDHIHIKMLSIKHYFFKESVLKTCYNELGLSENSQHLSFVSLPARLVAVMLIGGFENEYP
ncbi:hypothetical protein C0Q44_25480 [Paenibacillus sp. PCH8]|nr:hypothetical protein C0Q44_25480 [Paenibacillus sp. PCH8]